MKNWFTKLFKNIWSKLTGKGPDGTTILDSLFAIAQRCVEPLVGKDLDGDGRIAAWQEVVQAAEKYGLKHLQSLTGSTVFANLDTKELLRWLAIARTAASIAAVAGAGSVPQFRVIEMLVSQAYNFVNGDDTLADLKAKGLLPQ